MIPRFLGDGISLIDNQKTVENVINNGIIESDSLSNFIDHFRCWPYQARTMMEAEDYKTIRLRNLEGVGTFFRDEQMEVLTNQQRKEAWFKILRKTCEIPDLLGATIHFLYVGKK